MQSVRSDQMHCETGSYRIFRASSERKMAARTHTMLFVVRVVGEHQHLCMHAHLYVLRVSLSIRYTLSNQGSSQMKRYNHLSEKEVVKERDGLEMVRDVFWESLLVRKVWRQIRCTDVMYSIRRSLQAQLFSFKFVPVVKTRWETLIIFKFCVSDFG